MSFAAKEEVLTTHEFLENAVLNNALIMVSSRGRLFGDMVATLLYNHSIYPTLLNPRKDAEIQYNIAHISTRNTVEKCFGVWKQRFRILLSGMRENAKKTIIALAVLHNLAIDLQDHLSCTDDEDAENDYRYNSNNQSLEYQDRLQSQCHQNLTRRLFIEQFFSSRN